MSSYRQILFHIIIRTKDNSRTLKQENVRQLYAYIMGIIKSKNCTLYRINGTEDHIHFLSDLHPSVALADFLKDIKVSSSIWIKKSGLFPHFSGWSEGYGAFSYTWRDRSSIIDYIKNQQEHHRRISFIEEYRKLLLENGVKIDDRYFP